MTAATTRPDTDAALPAPIPQATLMRWFTVVIVTWTVLTSAAVLLVPGDPTDWWFDVMAVAPIAVLPAVWALACRRVPRFRATMLALDLSAITGLQLARAAGVAMLILWVAGAMTPVFALWAGGVDMLVALTALPMAYLVAAARPLPRWRLRTWHALGLLDFVVAVPLALLASPSAMRLIPGESSTALMVTFPLSFIPMVGVPLATVLHLTALMQLREGREPRTRSIVHA